MSLLSGNPCQSRAATIYTLIEESDLGFITQPKNGDLAIWVDEGVTYFWTFKGSLCSGEWVSGGQTGGGGSSGFLSGHGDPNGVQTGQIQGQTYVDLDDGSLWVFTGTVGTNTGWV